MIENQLDLTMGVDSRTAEVAEGISADLAAMMVMMMDQRDPYTSRHMSRVSWLAISIGKYLGYSDDRLFGLRIGSQLHDLGKSSIPPEILNKPGRLTAREIELVRDHPRNGFDIVNRVKWAWPVPEMVLQHHEKIDGGGYPFGIGGDRMLHEARIIAVADVVDAMVSHRPYRSALPVERAIDEITARRGTFYDGEIVEACVHLVACGKFEVPADLGEFGQAAERS